MNTLTLKDDKQGRQILGKRLAKLTAKEPYKHDKGDYSEGNPEYDGWCVFCTKCKTKLWNAGHQIAGHYTDKSKKPCPVPDPITISWETAMTLSRKTKGFRQTLHDWYGKKHDMFESLDEILEIDRCAYAWYVEEATPFEILRIVAESLSKKD